MTFGAVIGQMNVVLPVVAALVVETPSVRVDAVEEVEETSKRP